MGYRHTQENYYQTVEDMKGNEDKAPVRIGLFFN